VGEPSFTFITSLLHSRTCEITILPLKLGFTSLASYRCDFFRFLSSSFFCLCSDGIETCGQEHSGKFAFFICTPVVQIVATGSPSLVASDAIETFYLEIFLNLRCEVKYGRREHLLSSLSIAPNVPLIATAPCIPSLTVTLI